MLASFPWWSCPFLVNLHGAATFRRTCPKWSPWRTGRPRSSRSIRPWTICRPSVHSSFPTADQENQNISDGRPGPLDQSVDMRREGQATTTSGKRRDPASTGWRCEFRPGCSWRPDRTQHVMADESIPCVLFYRRLCTPPLTATFVSSYGMHSYYPVEQLSAASRVSPLAAPIFRPVSRIQRSLWRQRTSPEHGSGPRPLNKLTGKSIYIKTNVCRIAC